MNVKDLKEFNEEELINKEKQLKKELFDLNNQRTIGGGRVEKPSSFKSIRRDIARILTVLSERKSNGKKN